jgi:thymidylate synthase
MMRIINAQNVNDALPQAIRALHDNGIIQPSRNGNVYTFPYPVITIYDRPDEKVLFSSVRDANPFFHLLESMWMLSGKNDSKFLNVYVKNFGDRFAEQGGIIHGAYGNRWVHSLGFDQIYEIIQKLKNNPLDRQIVLQMWDGSSIGHNDLRENVLDRPCNTHIYFRIVDGKLDMTTMARSHDAIWGATGANAVHFPILQEYIAGMVGIPIGKFYQFSNNYHMYENVFDSMRAKVKDLFELNNELIDDRYIYHTVRPIPLVSDPISFDREFQIIMKCIDRIHSTTLEDESDSWDTIVKDTMKFKNEFLSQTVLPVAECHWIYRNKGLAEALTHATFIKSPDWQIACIEWLKRRAK